MSERQAFTEAWKNPIITGAHYWHLFGCFFFSTFTLASLKEKMQAKLDQLSGYGNSVYYY